MKKNLLSAIASVFCATNLFAQIDFNVTPINGCSPLTVTITNTSTSPAFRFEWYFGDGSSLIDTLPTTITHTYTSPGYYSPYVFVYTSGGSYLGYTYGSSGSIQVDGLYGISAPDSVCPGEAANFYANGGPLTTASWDFGDGNTSTQESPSHTYASTGTFTVTLTGTTSCGTATITRTIKVSNNVVPDANWWMNTSSPACPNQQIGFNTSVSASYAWNFGDGNTSTLQYPNHTYTTTGTFTVTLVKTNTCGNTNTYSSPITISSTVTFPSYPSFKLNANSSPTCPNSTVSFDAPYGYTNYEWNYGDGTPLVSTAGYSYTNHTYGNTLTTYTVSVRITNACGNDTTLYSNVQISATAPFPTSYFNLDVYSSPACPNTNVQFSVYGGSNASYQWNYGDGSPLATTTYGNSSHIYGSTLTTYTVSVRVTNFCGRDTTLYSTVQITNVVPFPNQSWFSLSAITPGCAGDPTTINAPWGYSSYAWDFGDLTTAFTTSGNGTHVYTGVGTYTVNVTITNACGNTTQLSTTVTIDNVGTFPSWLNIYANPNTGTCPNDIVQFGVSSDGYSSFVWDFGDGVTASTTGREIQHAYTLTGNYTVSCTVTNGCGTSTTLYTTVSVTASAPVDNFLSLNAVQSPSCPGDEVFFIPQSGQSSYTYYWNFGDGGKDTTIGTGTTHIFTAAGNYSVTLTAVNGCGSTKTVSMIDSVKNNTVPYLSRPDGEKLWGFPSQGDGGNTTAGCAGDAIIFYFMGSSANNLWNFGDGNTGTATETMLIYGGDGGGFPVTIIKHAYVADGTYTVSLTLTNSCGNSVTESTTLVVGGNLLVNGDMTTSPPPFTTCAPIDFLAFGGSDYAWSFGDGNTVTTTSPTVSHTFALSGVYVVNVTVTNGCGNSAVYSRSISVTGSAGLSVNMTSTNPSCIGNNGTATANVTSGQAPYIYLWDNGQTTSNATGLSAGTHSVSITDDNGCPNTTYVTLGNPAAMVLSASFTQTTCGGATGTATASVVSGGTAPYSYQWSSGGTAVMEDSLGWGAYSVLVTDVNGCSSTANVSISEIGAAAITVNTITNASCNASASGAININVTGGTPPYTYAWSNGSTVQDITGLTAGTYSVLVTDNGSCKATFNTTITEPVAIDVTTNVVLAPTCPNFDGKASASAANGTAPYTYLWVNAGSQTTTTATGLPAGTYSVQVTDASGCSVTDVISLSNSNAPDVTAVVTDVSCNSGSDANINITVTGGTSPYLYTWNVGPPQTNNQDINTLGVGNYFVLINDAAGCISVRNYTITQPDVLTASVSNTGATCGNNDGTATANPSGGTAPYTYSWNSAPVQTAQTASNLALGNYTVTTTDSKGCTTTATTTIAPTTLPNNVCLVTVNGGSTYNHVVWEKPVSTSIDSFRIYREITSSFVKIATVPYNALSDYTDSVYVPLANPNTTNFRYKVSVLDNCGAESALSAYHRTIFLQANIGVGTTVNLNWVPYEGTPVLFYRILRDTTGLGNWQAIDSVPGSNTVYTDLNPPTNPATLWYVLDVNWGVACNPTAAQINTSHSNFRTLPTTFSIPELTILGNQIMLFPNPVRDEVMISYPKEVKSMQLLDAIGRVVYSEENLFAGTKLLNVRSFAGGIYTLRFYTQYGIVHKKLAVN